MEDKTYNGWSNYETWLLKLNLDNDQGTYKMCKEFFTDNYNKDKDTYDLAKEFKDYLEELIYIEDHQIYKICDVWTTRDWFEIDFVEITESYIQDFKEELQEVEVD